MTKNVIQMHSVNPEEFKDQILEGVKKQLEIFSKNFKSKEYNLWISRKEAAEILGVTYPTLLDWNKKGMLHPFKVGHRVRYRRADIEKLLLSSNNKAPK